MASLAIKKLNKKKCEKKLSEEKRFTNKKLTAVSIVLVLMCGVTGVLGFTLVGVLNDNTSLSGDYDDLYINYLELSIDFNTLNDRYFILTGENILNWKMIIIFYNLI